MDDNKINKDKKLTNSNHNKTSDNEEDIQNYFNNIEIPRELSMSVKNGIEKATRRN